MPVHASVAGRFRYLDGLRSLREAYTDPVLIQQIRQFETWEPAAPPPAVHGRAESVPGPHGPVPVRLYTPSAGRPAPRAWCGCTAADSSAATSTCARQTGPRVRSARPAEPSWSASTAEYDHLRASGEAFTAAAALAGVDVRQVTVRGMLHGFLNLPAEVEPVRRCLALIAETVTRGGL